MADHTTPPDAITWYHAPWLEAADAGRLRYDTTRYPIHGLETNAVWCIWHGLLADDSDGPVLTELGRRLLDEYRAQREKRTAATAPAAAVCACQWGPTGHCGAGAHHQCVARVVETCETYLTNRAGACILADGAPVPVWLADRTCRWACPCDCHTPTPAQPAPAADPAPAAAAPGAPVQPALF